MWWTNTNPWNLIVNMKTILKFWVYYVQRWIPNDFGLIEPEPPINLYSILDLAQDGKSKKKKKKSLADEWWFKTVMKRLFARNLTSVWGEYQIAEVPFRCPELDHLSQVLFSSLSPFSSVFLLELMFPPLTLTPSFVFIPFH